MKKQPAENIWKTHFVVGAFDIVGNQFKFVGLLDVMLDKGLNFVAARVFWYVFCQDGWCNVGVKTWRNHQIKNIKKAQS